MYVLLLLCICVHKACVTQRTHSARDAVRNGLSDTVLRLQSESKKHVSLGFLHPQYTINADILACS